MLEMRYADKGSTHLRLAVSTQHYAFSVQAFVNVVEGCKGEEYEFILREAPRRDHRDVRTFRSEVGILYTDDSTGACCRRRSTTRRGLRSPVRRARARVRGRAPPAGGRHAAATRRPGRLPALLVRAGTTNSFYYSEEPLSHLPHKRNIRISDRGTLTNLLTSYNGYTCPPACCRPRCTRASPASRWTWTRQCRWLHHAQRAPPERPAAALHRRAARHHRRRPHRRAAP